MRYKLFDFDYEAIFAEHDVPYECRAIIDKLIELRRQDEHKNMEILKLIEGDPECERTTTQKRLRNLCYKQKKIQSHLEVLKEQVSGIVLFTLKARRGEVTNIDPVPLALYLNNLCRGPFKLYAPYDDYGRPYPYPPKPSNGWPQENGN